MLTFFSGRSCIVLRAMRFASALCTAHTNNNIVFYRPCPPLPPPKKNCTFTYFLSASGAAEILRFPISLRRSKSLRISKTKSYWRFKPPWLQYYYTHVHIFVSHNAINLKRFRLQLRVRFYSVAGLAFNPMSAAFVNLGLVRRSKTLGKLVRI